MTRLLVVAAGLLTSLAGQALSQTYPARPITVLINQETGGPTELFARALGKSFQDRGHPPFIVETRPGGGGSIGGKACAKSKPDGYTACIVPRDMVSMTAAYSAICMGW